MPNQGNPNSDQKTKKALKDFAKYSTLGIHMIAIMAFGLIGRIKQNNWIEGIEFPLFTIMLTLENVLFSIPYAIKDFIKLK